MASISAQRRSFSAMPEQGRNGQIHSAVLLNATTPNWSPGRSRPTARRAACFAVAIFSPLIEPERSKTRTSARAGFGRSWPGSETTGKTSSNNVWR